MTASWLKDAQKESRTKAEGKIKRLPYAHEGTYQIMFTSELNSFQSKKDSGLTCMTLSAVVLNCEQTPHDPRTQGAADVNNVRQAYAPGQEFTHYWDSSSKKRARFFNDVSMLVNILQERATDAEVSADEVDQLLGDQGEADLLKRMVVEVRYSVNHWKGVDYINPEFIREVEAEEVFEKTDEALLAQYGIAKE